jgi:zinc protease
MKKRHGAAVLVFVLLALARAGAAAAAPAPPLVTHRLPNGLEVLVYPDPVVPLITAELVVRNGASYETPATSGLAHLHEHLFWPDLATVGPAAARIRGRGISYNARTREESASFHLVAPREELRTALAYLRDAAGARTFPPERLAAQKETVLGEIARAAANPYTELNRRGRELLFPRNRTFKSPLGAEAIVSNAFGSQILALHRRFLTPGNMALVVTGDCDADEVLRLAAEYFGTVAAASPPGPSDPGPAPRSTLAEITATPRVEDVVVRLTWRGPGVETDRPATYAADILGEILAQPAGRFQRALVDSGLMIGIEVIYLTQRRTGLSSVTFRSTPETARDALRALRRELAALAEPGYFTDEELANARAALIADELFRREDLVEFSHSIGFWWASAGTDYLLDRLDATRRTGRTEITAYIRRYLQEPVHSAVALVPAGRQRRGELTEKDLLAP